MLANYMYECYISNTTEWEFRGKGTHQLSSTIGGIHFCLDESFVLDDWYLCCIKWEQ